MVAGSSLGLRYGRPCRAMSRHTTAVVTVGAFIAGNVIAQSAILRLSIRTTTQEDAPEGTPAPAKEGS